MERFFDIFFACLAIAALSPVLIVVAMVLFFTGEGEVFYLQKRIGKGRTHFNLIKFATMVKASPTMNSGSITRKNDPRVLPVGKVLRKTKVNELPQLLNVVAGDMSLIGPRPLTEQTFNMYSSEVQKSVESSRPGLSGIGSIILRGEEELLVDDEQASLDFYANTIAPYKGALEEWFIKNRSITLYFLAIFLTVWVVFFPKSKLMWRVFSDLPQPPVQLRDSLGYPESSVA